MLDWSKLKASAGDKINGNQKKEFCTEKDRKQRGKRRKMMLPSIFSFSHNVVKKFLSWGSLKGLCGYGLTLSLIQHFESQTVPYSKKLQTTTEMWLFKDFKIRFHRKHCGKR